MMSHFLRAAIVSSFAFSALGVELPQKPAMAGAGVSAGGATAGIGVAAPAAAAPTEVKPLTGKEIPGLDLKYPDLALYNAVQFGEKPEEIIYFVYAVRRVEPSSSSKKEAEPNTYEMLYAYTPYLPDFKKPKLLRGKVDRERLESGYMSGEFVTYPSIKLQTRKGPSIINMDFALFYRGGRPQADVGLQLIHEGKSARMLIKMDRLKTSAAEAPIKAFNLFEQPNLKMRVMDNGKSVAATLALGEEDRILVPISGMLGSVVLTVKCDGRVVETKKMSVDEKLLDKGEDFLDVKTGRLAPGKSYTFELNADLGPLGKPTATQDVTVEAKQSKQSKL